MTEPFAADQLQYRPLEPRDEAAVRALHACCFPVPYEDAFFAAALSGADGVASLGAFEAPGRGGGLVGCVSVRTAPLGRTPDSGGLLDPTTSAGAVDATYILTLGVLPSARRAGVARALLRWTVAAARSRPATRLLFLHVLCGNAAALSLYESEGFAVARLERSFYRLDRGRMPPYVRDPSRARHDALALAMHLNGGRPPEGGCAAPQPSPAAAGDARDGDSDPEGCDGGFLSSWGGALGAGNAALLSPAWAAAAGGAVARAACAFAAWACAAALACSGAADGAHRGWRRATAAQQQRLQPRLSAVGPAAV